MNFKKPIFWDLKKPNIFSYLLIPFTIPIIINNFFLNFQKKYKFSKIKTICIGNIYLGGTGKTPLTIKLFNIIVKMGFNVITAKKFYSNQIDEQNLLKTKTKTLVTKRRVDAINQAVNSSNQVIIFDDGLQEKKIDYDLKIVCFKKKNWIGNGQLIPSGPLREKIENLKNYDIVFLNGRGDNSENIKKIIYRLNPKIEIFESDYEIQNLNELDINSNYLIFSGIGDPLSFKEILLKNNISVVKEIIFPDHYKYKKKDIEKVLQESKKLNAKILTTEKDFIKLSDEDAREINFLKIELKIDKEEQLLELINDKLN
tara:strand:- start:451 stop:1392 length:942 start_codon:yes stop_codon:yes gene_type:complete